jgi:hypothetical protein
VRTYKNGPQKAEKEGYVSFIHAITIPYLKQGRKTNYAD